MKDKLSQMQLFKALNFVLFISLLAFMSCGENPSNGTEKIKISVKIDGSGNYDEVRLQKVNSDYSIELVESANFVEDEIEFNVFVFESTLYRLDFMGYTSLDLILNKSDVDILVDDSNSLFEFTVDGSDDTEILKSIENKITNYRSEIRELNINFVEASQNRDYELINSIQSEFDFKKNQFELSLKDYLSSVKSSLAVLVTADYLDIEENLIFWETIFNNYTEEFKNNSYFQNFESKLIKIKSISIGSIAPDIILNDTSGIPITLTSLRGKYVLLDFWAAWCRPCREENPNIVENYNNYKSHGFDVYQVSLDRTKEDWVRGIKQDKLQWINVSDLKYYQSEAAELYNVDRIPSAFLLDPDGKIIAKHTDLRGPNLSRKLGEIFN
ncbi:MAG: TlpA family protein disulfide reductase [Flammeovirgaceae bacterium TMED290]|nr:MAG: TlpA family protein disulfide reductase [Flammeovirgaceae bacterium TMED290]|tara:strand:+ start:6272 stop:7423 length:1152 start_codon:yes stop_codon:yes gene_type:complete